MRKLPQASGEDVIKLLQSLGYDVTRRHGSHVNLRKITSLGEHNITVPAHKVLAKGTLSDILHKVSLWNNIPREELLRKLG